jgi:lipopolysaccharide transport system ATP-binding protein
MSEPAIIVEGLSKSYRIQHQIERYPTIRAALVRAAAAPWKRFRQLSGRAGGNGAGQETFWALRDVSLTVQPGEVVGIIGRNGAGKSTLLKILSRITEPTAGRVVLNGRAASLLEVGTGFHPELTGRENIYLNGAILGMKKAEVRRKFDEIVAFAEVEKFLDTPVKFYSSGMYVRLAFAVAAHLEPEILIVDEVLAVGDISFQRKCLGRMQQFAQGTGRTVLFVSHNLASLRTLCTRGILLHQGHLVFSDAIDVAVQAYLNSLEEPATSDLSSVTARRGEGRVRFQRVTVSSGGHVGPTVSSGGPVRFDFHFTSFLPGLVCGFIIHDQFGQPLAGFDSRQHGREDRQGNQPATTLICEIDEFLFAPGRYRVNAAVDSDGVLQDHIEAAVFIDVVPGMVRGRPTRTDAAYGHTLIPHRWIAPGLAAAECES